MPAQGAIFARLRIPATLYLTAFVTLGIILYPSTGPGSATNELALHATRGPPSVAVQVNYSRGFDATCDPVSVTVHFQGEVTGGEPPYFYSWFFGDGGTSTEPDPSHTYTAIGVEYTVILLVTDANGTVAPGSLRLQPPPPPCPPRAFVGPLGISWGLWAICVGAIATAAVLVVALPRFRREHRKP